MSGFTTVSNSNEGQYIPLHVSQPPLLPFTLECTDLRGLQVTTRPELPLAALAHQVSLYEGWSYGWPAWGCVRLQFIRGRVLLGLE